MIHFLSRSLFEWHLFDFENPPSGDLPPPQWHHPSNSPWCDLLGIWLVYWKCFASWNDYFDMSSRNTNLKLHADFSGFKNHLSYLILGQDYWSSSHHKGVTATWILPSLAPSQVSIIQPFVFLGTLPKTPVFKIHPPRVQQKTHKIHSGFHPTKGHTQKKLHFQSSNSIQHAPSGITWVTVAKNAPPPSNSASVFCSTKKKKHLSAPKSAFVATAQAFKVFAFPKKK